MGFLADQIPNDDNEAYQVIIDSINRNYPDDWKSWEVSNYTYKDLFGDENPTITESKLRFGIPTLDIVKAFMPNGNTMSERSFRLIRKIIIKWPLGRALIYAPHAVMEKVHAKSYREFMTTIRELKPKLTNRENTQIARISKYMQRIDAVLISFKKTTSKRRK